MITPDSVISESLIDAITTKNGALVMLAEVYVDESGTHDQSEFMVIAGYVYLRKKAKRFSAELSTLLKKYGLPYFHMVDCAHRTPPFDRLNKQECINIEKSLIGLVRKYSECGFAVIINKRAYQACVPDPSNSLFGGVYSFALISTLSMVRKWREKTGFKGDVSYIFESGHKSQKEANNVLNFMMTHEPLRNDHNYVSHTFANKTKFLPLQSADLMAWQMYTQAKRDNEKPRKRHGMRKDLEALLRPDKDLYAVLGPESLIKMRDQLKNSHFADLFQQQT